MEREELTEEQSQHMRAFIAALRSGNYRQGRRYLKTTYNYDTTEQSEVPLHCCLGVAVEQAIIDGCPVQWRTDFSTSYAVPDANQSGQDAKGLPYVLQTWYGIENMYGYVTVACRELGRRSADLLCSGGAQVAHSVGGDLETCDGIVRIEATKLNDTYKWTFNQIADAFESTYLHPAVPAQRAGFEEDQ
jgi:hypothetical protein